MAGGAELLLQLIEFHPDKRATALDVFNYEFMTPVLTADSPMHYYCC
jgi:hypothetical protein